MKTAFNPFYRCRFKDFYELWPDKFQNKTNGVTPRRWLKLINPGLTKLLNDKLGDDWVVDLDRMRDLTKFANDDQVLDAIIRVSTFHRFEACSCTVNQACTCSY